MKSSSYFLNFAVVRAWTEIDESLGTVGMPMTLLLFSGKSELIRKFDVSKFPLTVSDVRRALHLTKKNSVIFCPSEIATIVKKASDASYKHTIIVKELADQHPSVASYFADYVARETALIRSERTCTFCTNAPGLCEHEPSRRCFCQPMMSIPGMTEGFFRSVFKTAQEFWQAKLWLQLRMNHVLRITDTGTDFQFAHVFGGAGESIVFVAVHKEWDTVQKGDFYEQLSPKNWHTLFRIDFQSPSEGHCWEDLDYLEDQRKNGTPFPLPDTDLADCDPALQKVLPKFYKQEIKIGPNRFRNSLMTVEEIRYCQYAMAAMIHIFNSNIMRPVPGTSLGDYRQYYPFNAIVPVPDYIVAQPLSSLPIRSTVRVKYPAVDDPSVMSDAQKMVVAYPENLLISAVAGGFTDTPVDTLEKLHAITTRKNDYSALIDEFETLYLGLTKASHTKDTAAADDFQLIYNRFTLYQNRLQASFKLQNYEDVIRDATIIVPTRDGYVPSPATARALYARARAHMQLEQYSDAVLDFELAVKLSITRECSTKGLPTINELKVMIDEARQKKEETDSLVTWRRLPTTGSARRRFFHVTVLHPDETCLISFGGRTKANPFEDRFDNTVSILTFKGEAQNKTGVWSGKTCSGDCPPGLAGASAVVYGRYMYMFGGQTDPMKTPWKVLLGDKLTGGTTATPFYRLNLDTYHWELLSYANQPCGDLYYHSAVLHGDEMVVFGGRSDESHYYNATHIFNFTTTTWTSITPPVAAAAASASVKRSLVEQQLTASTILWPSPRCSHIAWINRHKHMIFSGGERLVEFPLEDPYKYSNQIFAFDLEKKEWLGQVELPNSLESRSETQAVCFKGSATYIFGGYTERSYQKPLRAVYYADGVRVKHHKDGTTTWSGMVSAGGDVPPARAGCTLTLDSFRKRALLVGGYNGSGGMSSSKDAVFDDVWEVTVSRRDSSSGGPQIDVNACEYCHRPSGYFCSSCLAVVYCSANCQKSHWEAHKAFCKEQRLKRLLEESGDDDC